MALDLRCPIPTEEETIRLAQTLSDQLGAGDVLLLWGEIGAGKTFFARHLIQALQAVHGPAEEVPSPTFTIVQVYEAGELEIWHTDLYRLASVDDCVELGLLDAFETALCLVEWPDRLQDAIPAEALHLRFNGTGAERSVTLSATAPRWRTLRLAA